MFNYIFEFIFCDLWQLVIFLFFILGCYRPHKIRPHVALFILKLTSSALNAASQVFYEF